MSSKAIRTFLGAVVALGIVLTAGGVHRAGAAATGLVAAYSFDQSGTTFADASGNANHATGSGTTWSSAGKYGGALSFNGTSSIVSIADSPSLDLSSGLTIEAWVQPTASSASQALVTK